MGDLVGENVGRLVGGMVGNLVGESVTGMCVGSPDGIADGTFDGNAEGALLGIGLGASVGLSSSTPKVDNKPKRSSRPMLFTRSSCSMLLDIFPTMSRFLIDSSFTRSSRFIRQLRQTSEELLRVHDPSSKH